MKRILAVLIVLLAAAALAWALTDHSGQAATGFRLTEVQTGDLEATVSATGNLDALTTVQVGTQVSGLVEAILVDYNDLVTAGQVIARLDTTLLANAVDAARAQLARAEAESRQAEREYRRLAALYDEQMVAESDLNLALSSREVAAASVQSAAVDLARARQNLGYATITAPIDGVVIARSVDEGQTVQSSLSAPELFRIAGDLTRMQILVAVDESDIGRIAAGQRARFTVQAYPDDSFDGMVRQVRLDAATTENVVNYTVVVDVDNPDGRLPGMTATVDVLVETASDVLYVSNAALRYQPDQAVLEAVRERKQRERGDQAGPPPSPPADGAAGERGVLWTLTEQGDLDPIRVVVGLSDGTHTAVASADLSAGQAVVVGKASQASVQSTGSSPFQQNGGERRQGPPPPGGF